MTDEQYRIRWAQTIFGLCALVVTIILIVGLFVYGDPEINPRYLKDTPTPVVTQGPTY